MRSISSLRTNIIERRRSIPSTRSVLVGISGIDASGKGQVSRLIAEDLEVAGLKVAVINVDGWLNLPDVRFVRRPLGNGAAARSSGEDGKHFYRHALRLDEMFAHLILPLKNARSVDLTANFTEETATEYRQHTYRFEDVDIVLLEGIFIFKREFVRHFDLKVWIDCSFDTALRRAVVRSQENLPPRETIAAYRAIYFPAQQVHFNIDDPMRVVDLIYRNDD